MESGEKHFRSSAHINANMLEGTASLAVAQTLKGVSVDKQKICGFQPLLSLGEGLLGAGRHSKLKIACPASQPIKCYN